MIKFHNRVRAALLGCAAALPLAAPLAAQAGDCCRWELRIKRHAVLSDKFTAELWAHFPDSGYAFFEGNLDIRTDGVEWLSVESVGETFFGSPGQIEGSDVEGIYLIHEIGFAVPATDNPIQIWQGEFEAACRTPQQKKIWTETNAFTYFLQWPETELKVCDSTVEANRTFLCGPLVLDPWIAAPMAATGRIVGEVLELVPDTPGARFGAMVADETVDWSSREPSFALDLSLDGLEPGTTIDTSWFTWFYCGTESGILDVRTTVGRDSLSIVPDFSRVGTRVVPVSLFREGKLVAETRLDTGSGLALHRFCANLEWSLAVDEFGRPRLLLGCADTFFVVDPTGAQFEVDRIELGGIGMPGDFAGMDGVEVIATGSRLLTILTAGAGDRTCLADCDGDGQLDIFDFLCFQNAFASGDLRADCDGDGQLDIFDFLCFQSAFAAGCP